MTSETSVGALVQANCGRRAQLLIDGFPVGKNIPGFVYPKDNGSIIIVIATDVPLLPHQLKRIAKRATLGVAVMGGIGGNSSGDIFVAFSTANSGAARDSGLQSLVMLPNEQINPVYEATRQATEEAIVNAMVAAETMTGANDVRVFALPHDRLRQVLAKYNRLVSTPTSR